jgi:hypothetical protein
MQGPSRVDEILWLHHINIHESRGNLNQILDSAAERGQEWAEARRSWHRLGPEGRGQV